MKTRQVLLGVALFAAMIFVAPGRSLAASQGDLMTFFIYPGNAGHDYGTIERQGFRKLVVERDHRPQVIDNPRWFPPEKR